MKEFIKGVGIWQILGESYITEIIAAAGFDLTIFDLEHGNHSPQTITNCVYAAKSLSLKTIARVLKLIMKT